MITYRAGDKVLTDDATGRIVEVDSAGFTVQWSEESEGGVQRYTWAEADEYGISFEQR